MGLTGRSRPQRQLQLVFSRPLDTLGQLRADLEHPQCDSSVTLAVFDTALLAFLPMSSYPAAAHEPESLRVLTASILVLRDPLLASFLLDTILLLYNVPNVSCRPCRRI
jgi:hypothetical protein